MNESTLKPQFNPQITQITQIHTDLQRVIELELLTRQVAAYL